MHAIVLTFDKNTVLTEHMIRCYEELWPDHPFIFRIPYQSPARKIPHAKRIYIHTPPEIKPTVLTLLADLDDDEWIFWSIDDRFPTKLNTSVILYLIENLLKNTVEHFSGLLFCRSKIMMKRKLLKDEGVNFMHFTLFEREGYWKIWMPQFLKVKVIRHIFNNFPDVIEKAIDMDDMKNRLEKPYHHRLFVTMEDYADFEESTIGGVLTELCFNSLVSRGFPLPGWYSGETVKNPVRHF